MRPIIFDIQLFTSRKDIKRSRKALLWLMESLCNINVGWLNRHPTPPLYKTDVIYVPESGTEIWRDIPTILALGHGDCEDLACWRVGELRSIGIHAKPYLKWRTVGDTNRFHAVVLLPDGRVEDPSRALGMNNRPIVRKPFYIKP